MPEIGSGDDKELNFVILFMLNIISDVIHDVIDNMFTSKGFH